MNSNNRVKSQNVKVTHICGHTGWTNYHANVQSEEEAIKQAQQRLCVKCVYKVVSRGFGPYYENISTW